MDREMTGTLRLAALPLARRKEAKKTHRKADLLLSVGPGRPAQQSNPSSCSTPAFLLALA